MTIKRVQNSTNTANKSDTLFGNADVLMSTDTAYMGFNFQNPFLDDQSYGMKSGVFGLFKSEFFYDELTHHLSYGQLTPATGVGSDIVVVPVPVPTVNKWSSFDSSVEVKKTGVDLTVDTENPFYFKLSADQQRKEGLRARGLYASTANL